MNSLTKQLIDSSEPEYRAFSEKLIPSTKYEILGVRVPIIRNIAKNNYKDEKTVSDFLNENHTYYEEWFLHGILISKSKDLDYIYSKLNDFLPHVDNWAICDSVSASMKIFEKNEENLEKTFNFIKSCLKSDKIYVIRFAIVAILDYYIIDKFIDRIIPCLLEVKSNEYYINMALAWVFAELLVKKYDGFIKIIESKTLPAFVQNMTIKKATESFRLNTETKNYLKKYKI